MGHGPDVPSGSDERRAGATQDDDRLPRKLAAILYADVAGYSRLTGEDEDATHRRLRAYLDLIADAIESHRGRVMHYAGDAVLAMFEAVVDAVTCAAGILATAFATTFREVCERRRRFSQVTALLVDDRVERHEEQPSQYSANQQNHKVCESVLIFGSSIRFRHGKGRRSDKFDAERSD